MAHDSEHPEYSTRKIQWDKLRDCAAGQEAIHAKTTVYLPKLSGQTADDYKAYRDRTPFYGATPRTIDGLSGMVFRKEPHVEVPDGFKPFLNDITLGGMDLNGFAEQIVDDDITVGRAGILVDHPSVAADTTKAQAEAQNIRPFLKHYAAENIFNWKVEGRKNAQVLTQVRLWEYAELRKSEFEVEVRKQIRILDLNEVGQYRQRIFIKAMMPTTMREEWIQLGPDIIPLKSGTPLDFIPFWFVGVKNNDACPEKPPLIDLANMNISHYKSTADLEHGAHFTGLPTAVITGHTEDPTVAEEEYRIGSATAWVFPNEGTTVEYLEFQGTGLDALEKRCLKKEEYMAFLGARMLSPDKKGIEAAETAQIHRLGETSVLSSLAQSAGQSIEAALKFMADWAGFAFDKITFKFNNDFLAVPMDAQALTALLATWQAGGIAFEDFLDNLKRGEIVREERTAEDIKSEVEQENPFDAQDMTDPAAPPVAKPKKAKKPAGE